MKKYIFFLLIIFTFIILIFLVQKMSLLLQYEKTNCIRNNSKYFFIFILFAIVYFIVYERIKRFKLLLQIFETWYCFIIFFRIIDSLQFIELYINHSDWFISSLISLEISLYPYKNNQYSNDEVYIHYINILTPILRILNLNTWTNHSMKFTQAGKYLE